MTLCARRMGNYFNTVVTLRGIHNILGTKSTRYYLRLIILIVERQRPTRF